MTTRRDFVSAALVGLAPKSQRAIAGGFVDDYMEFGHRLRDMAVHNIPKETRRTEVVIVGAGVAGLSAAWQLAKHGFRDFVVLEMAKQAGGNARSGQCELTAYPWAAHYIPVPQTPQGPFKELFTDLGVYRNGEWDERHLVHSPKERLFLHGRWQEGIEPEIGATRRDREQRKLFHERMAEFRATGAFQVPHRGLGSDHPLDRETMGAWLARNGFDSPLLRWEVDYACRDDYGALARDVSAWAGVHYYASRPPEDREMGPLVWPEGNGWVIKRLMQTLGTSVHTSEPVHRIQPQGARWAVDTAGCRWLATWVIFAAPLMVAPLLIEGAPKLPASHVYSPWLTANLFLDRQPRFSGAEPAWDNVIYGSRSLGYVDAMHQSLGSYRDKTVWTYYWALAEHPPPQARRALIDHDWAFWRDAILTDLRRAHPDIDQCVSRLEILRLAHAMLRPLPGFLRSPAYTVPGRIVFAHSDVSRLPLFEEALQQGFRAAQLVLRKNGFRR